MEATRNEEEDHSTSSGGYIVSRTSATSPCQDLSCQVHSPHSSDSTRFGMATACVHRTLKRRRTSDHRMGIKRVLAGAVQMEEDRSLLPATSDTSLSENLPFSSLRRESSQLHDGVHDPLIYPGIYAPSGFDMMSILVRSLSSKIKNTPTPAFPSSACSELCQH